MPSRSWSSMAAAAAAVAGPIARDVLIEASAGLDRRSRPQRAGRASEPCGGLPMVSRAREQLGPWQKLRHVNWGLMILLLPGRRHRLRDALFGGGRQSPIPGPDRQMIRFGVGLSC